VRRNDDAEDVTEVSAGDSFFGAPRSRDGLQRGARRGAERGRGADQGRGAERGRATEQGPGADAGRGEGLARGGRGAAAEPASWDPEANRRHRGTDAFRRGPQVRTSEPDFSWRGPEAGPGDRELSWRPSDERVADQGRRGAELVLAAEAPASEWAGRDGGIASAGEGVADSGGDSGGGSVSDGGGGKRRRRWLGPSLIGGAVVCSLALITGAATQFASSACAAPPPAGVASTGNATFYDGGDGNCSYPDLPADDLYVALGPAEYSASAACGSYLDVTGPNGSVRVKVVDQCPECAVGHLDLSREAFAEIADPDAGDVPITYQAVRNPAVPGKLSVRVKEGSSADWLALLIDNHGNPLTKVVVGSTALTRTSYNYWIADGGLGAGPFTVRLTDSEGRTATIPGVTLSPGEVQESTVAMSVGAAAPATSKPLPRASSGPVPRANSSVSDSYAPPVAAAGPVTGAAGSMDPATNAAASPAASATGTLPANPDPSSSVAVPQQTETPAVATGRNSCG
jgi:expansin (peptidoglycan-binding protein)